MSTANKAKLITEADTEALFSGIELTTEAKEDFAIKLEAQIISKVDTLKEELESANDVVIATKLDEQTAEMETNINTYLDYVIEAWATDNEVAIASGIKLELAENFIKGMQTVFTESYIDLPTTDIELIKEADDKVIKLESELASQIQKVADLKENQVELQRSEIIKNSAGDLTESQIEKLTTLAEGFEFKSTESFTKKITALKATHFKIESVDDGSTAKPASASKPLVESNDMDAHLANL